MRRIAFAVFAAAGCSALPELEPNTCRNGVVELGEDCDLYVNEAQQSGQDGPFACGGSCRYICPSDGSFVCPKDFSCGADALCRLPSGTFGQAAESPLSLDATQIAVADMDGDGVQDVIGGSADLLEIRYGVGDGTYRDPFQMTIDFPLGDRILADVDADDRMDIVIPYAVGFDVLRGDSARRLIPGAYPPFQLDQMRSDGATDFVFLTGRFGSDGGSELPFGVSVAPGTLDVMAPLELEIDRIMIDEGLATLASIDVGDITGDAADEIVVAVAGADEVWLGSLACASPCTAENSEVVFTRLPISIGTIRSEGALVVDVSSDGVPDVLVSVDTTSGPATVALINRAGSFQPTSFPTFSTWPIAAARSPNGALFVFPSRIASLSSTTADLVSRHENLLPPWDRAVIGDFDGDGRLDVAASSRLASITLLMGEAPSVFHRIDVGMRGHPDHIAAGDFDGDGISDVAAILDIDGASEVDVVFGGPGAPKPPAFMARLPPVANLRTVGVGVAVPPNADRIDDLALEVGGGAAPDRAVLLIGTAQRRMRSPIPLERDYAFAGPYAITSGTFDNPGGIDLAALTVEGMLFIARSKSPDQFDVSDNIGLPISELCNQSKADLESGCARIAAGNLRAGGNDELVIANRSSACTGNAVLSVVAVDQGSLGCESIDLARDGLIRHRTARFDADSFDDVVALFAAKPHIVVIFGGGGRQTLPDLPDEIVPLDFAVFGQRIAVLTTSGVYANTKDPSRFDLVASQPVSRGSRIATAQTDSDGLDDLIFGTARRTYIFTAGERFQNQ